MKQLPITTKLMGLTRWFSVVAVLSSLVGALLMFVIGAANTGEAVMRYLDVYRSSLDPVAAEANPRPAANLLLLESLDNGLTGLTFLYFSYGIYALFLSPTEDIASRPRWMKVDSIESLKKTLLQVVGVLIAVMFVRTLAERLLADSLTWEILIMPAGVLAIAMSSRLMFSTSKALPTTGS